MVATTGAYHSASIVLVQGVNVKVNRTALYKFSSSSYLKQFQPNLQCELFYLFPVLSFSSSWWPQPVVVVMDAPLSMKK